RAHCLALSTTHALALVDPKPVVVEGVGLALLHPAIAGESPLVIAQQRGNLDDAVRHRLDLQALVAKDTLRVDDLELVVAEVATRRFQERLRLLVAGLDFVAETAPVERQRGHAVDRNGVHVSGAASGTPDRNLGLKAWSDRGY